MKIHLATDHAGFAHKEAVKKYLADIYEVMDHGAFIYDGADDYPDFIRPCAEAVAIDSESRGIIFGHSGQGESMVANRTTGIRAAVYYGGSQEILTLSREHNDANILSLGTHFISEQDAIDAVTLWLATTFSQDERHIRRLAKL
jgi:ribose 5-phosphate isomerase B